jgi:prepilin-type N-terminal cleavage/methylation domain-containing protein
VAGTTLRDRAPSNGSYRTAEPSADHSGGFSVTELVVVITILTILAAIAIPQIKNAVYMSHVRGAADSLSALIQQAREAAEQHDATIPFYAATVGTGSVQGAFVSCSANSCPDTGTWNVGDPYIPYGADVSNAAAAGAPAGLNPGFTPEAAGTVLYLSPFGLAYKSSGASYTGSKGFVYYLSDSHNDWAAVSVSPMGRSRVWVYSGGWQ